MIHSVAHTFLNICYIDSCPPTTKVLLLNIGKKRGFSHRLVTLDGELITPGGALTGGNHNKEQKGLLLRQRQIEELTEQVAELRGKTVEEIRG